MTQKNAKRQPRKDAPQEQESQNAKEETTDITDLMADIDSTLEEMGEEFAANFKQKGGQ